MERIGLFGGTFSPPHVGHLHLAACVRDALRLDRVIFIPAGTPPHKTLPPGTPSGVQRLAMLRIAVRTFAGGETDDLELMRSGPSYTALTAEEMAHRYPDAVRWLIMGSDMLLSMESWYEPARIYARCRIAAAVRGEGEETRLREHAALLAARYGAQVDCVRMPPLPISSTALRAMLPSAQAASYLPDGVYEYIVKEGLYTRHDHLC